MNMLASHKALEKIMYIVVSNYFGMMAAITTTPLHRYIFLLHRDRVASQDQEHQV